MNPNNINETIIENNLARWNYNSSLSNKVYLFLEGPSFLKVDSGGVVGLLGLGEGLLADSPSFDLSST